MGLCQMKKRPYSINVHLCITRNDRAMGGRLETAEWMKHLDWCHGIHGAAKWRKGIKKATSAARRRLEKKLIIKEMEG